MRQGRWAVATGLLLLMAAPVRAADEQQERGAVTVGGGIFAPFDGDVGGSALLGAEGRVTDHVSVGGEVAYQRFDTPVTGLFGTRIDDARVDAVQLRALVRYAWNPGLVQPYLGGGGGIGIYDVQGRSGSSSIEGTGVSLNLLGLAGVDVPIGSHLALFAEGRVSGDVANLVFWSEQFGGASALTGARVRF
jgi:hypothetical protein